MSESSSDGPRYPGRARAAGTSAALFEHAPRPMAAVRGRENPEVEVVNRAFLERFEGRTPRRSNGGCFPLETALGDVERRVVRMAAGGTVERDIVTKTTPDGRRTFAVRAIPVDRVELDAYLQYREITAEQIREQQLAVLRRVFRHDLRNDLTILLGYAETIAETASDPKIREQATAMVEAASDLRSVATAAGRMQCVTAAPEWIDLGAAVATARRSVSTGDAAVVSIEGAIPPTSVDRRVAIALEELCGTLVERADASELALSVETADGWATLTLDADAALCEQERAALRGHDETQLRHATGLSPWIARWAVRAAGGRLHVEGAPDRCSVVVAVPVRDATEDHSGDSAIGTHSCTED